ncbi:MAG: leucine-rich repeat protein, partial [Clostridia bacterium]|nr:leucine-rich repeat protein [Clostridia bacterium]
KGLKTIDINADVIPAYAFYGCESLTNVYLGKDVKTIGEFAFANTNVSKFNFWADGVTTNGTLTLKKDGAFIYNGTELVLSAPTYVGEYVDGRTRTVVIPNGTTSIANGAFAGNRKAQLDDKGQPKLDSEGNVLYDYIRFVKEEKSASEEGYVGVENIGAYAFAEGLQLEEVAFASLKSVGDYAFYGTSLKATPDLSKTANIGEYAFAFTQIQSVVVASGAEAARVQVGDYAFAYNVELKNVTLGDYVNVGEGAFYCPMYVYAYEQTGELYPTQTGGLEFYDVYNYEVQDENGNVVETYSYYRYNFAEFAFSTLNTLTVGKNAKIGDYAFAGSVKLTEVTLGDGVSIGDYAFYNAISLAQIDLSAVTEIGESAFSGTYTLDLWKQDNVWGFAYAFSAVEGENGEYELVATDYKYSSCAPAFTSVTLNALTYLGEGAFANNKSLASITFGESLDEVAAYAFMGTTALTSVTLPQNITALGDYAFYNSGLASINLENIQIIGDGALGITKLTAVTLKEGATVGDGAFAYCFDLADVENLEDVIYIGANAFGYVALEEATLTAAQYIGDFAFAQSNVQKVVLGESLKLLGENPFYACFIETFGKETEIKFQDKVVGTEVTQTYDVSDKVKVIDGVLYQVVDNGGLELVSYPLAKTDVTFTVEEGTVRISASAFSYAALSNVVLPSTLKAVGDKAFYGCGNLSTVTFTSYEAPILEEEYNEEILYKLLPYTGNYNGYVGLGISPYFMWSAINQYNTYYYGANFLSYVGTIPESDKLVMVKPVNGQNYDTFIMSQYFGTTVEGNVAAVEVTLTVITGIKNLPAISKLTLEYADTVSGIRSLYEGLANDQKALVSNYETLLQAEAKINRLTAGTVKPPVEEIDPVEKPENNGVAVWI